MSPSPRASTRVQAADPPSALLVDEALQASKRGHKLTKSVEEEAYLEDLDGAKDADSLDGSDNDSDSINGVLNRSSWSKMSSASRNADNVDSYLDKLQKYLDGGDS